MNNQTYTDRLAGLRRALATALSDAQHTVAFGWIANDEEREERATLAYVNLWDATAQALLTHTDAPPHEVLSMIAGTMEMRLGVPIVGVVEDGVITMTMNVGGRLKL